MAVATVPTILVAVRLVKPVPPCVTGNAEASVTVPPKFTLLAYNVFDPNESAKVQKSPEQILKELVKYHIRGIATDKGLIELEKLNWK